jgi:hypothetical protein
VSPRRKNLKKSKIDVRFFAQITMEQFERAAQQAIGLPRQGEQQ